MKQDSSRYHRHQRYLTGEINILKGVQINWKLVESQKVWTN